MPDEPQETTVDAEPPRYCSNCDSLVGYNNCGYDGTTLSRYHRNLDYWDQSAGVYQKFYDIVLCDDCTSDFVAATIVVCELCGDDVYATSYVDDNAAYVSGPIIGSPQFRHNLAAHEGITDEFHERTGFEYEYLPTRNVCRNSHLTWCSECQPSCNGCDEYVDGNQLTDWSGDYDDVNCGYCRRESSVVFDWSYVPRLHFRDINNPPSIRATPGVPYLGIELETEEMSTSNAETTQAEFDSRCDNLIWMKRDGSLGDEGVELVTHPATFEWLAQHFPFEVLGGAYKRGARSYSEPSTGIHIHISASAFTPSHMFKFLEFHYRNPTELQHISQRASGHYSSWSEWLTTRPDIVEFATKKKKPASRYMAVNLTEDETIELRYFKGNMSPDRLRKNIELVDAMFRYTKSIPAVQRDTGLTWAAFDAWLKRPDNMVRYPNLCKFIEEKGVGTRRPDFTETDIDM